MRLLKIPYAYPFPMIVIFCCVGVYSVNYRVFDVLMMAGFGVFGYVLRQIGCEAAPLVLGFVLGPRLEEEFRRTLLLSDGDFTVFLTRPLSAALVGATALLLILMALPAIRKKREVAVRE